MHKINSLSPISDLFQKQRQCLKEAWKYTTKDKHLRPVQAMFPNP